MSQKHQVARAQPRPAETDVDLIGAHLDPVDQGSEDSTLAFDGHSGRRLPISATRATSRCCIDESASHAAFDL
jgi:hypothetical protein